MSNSDIEWFNRFKDECDVAGFAVTCPDCMKVMRDKNADPFYDQKDNCHCHPPIDYGEVAEVLGLGLFKSMFHFTESTYAKRKLGLAR